MHAVGTAVQAVGNRCRGRLVEQAVDVQSRQTRRILGRLALCIVEIGWHGNHHTVQITTQRFPCALRKHLEDLGRDLDRRDLAGNGSDTRDGAVTADEFVGQFGTERFHVSYRTTDQPLGRRDGIERVARRRLAGSLTHLHTVAGIPHDGGKDVAPLCVGEGLRMAASDGGHQ